MASVTAYDKAMDLHCYIRGGGRNKKPIMAMWHATFSRAAREMGFGRKATRILWEQLSSGGWEMSSPTEEVWLERLDAELFHCSDRWTLERLVRCNMLLKAYEEDT